MWLECRSRFACTMLTLRFCSADARPAASRTKQDRRQTLAGLRVCLVDDNVVNNKLAGRILKMHGAEGVYRAPRRKCTSILSGGLHPIATCGASVVSFQQAH